MSFLQFHGITKRYGAIPALAGVNLTVAQGSTLALLGPNGAGKSTLFGCLLGLTHPTSGMITLQGRAVGGDVLCRFGYVAERIALYPHRTVWDNGMFFARLKNRSAAEFKLQLKRVGMDEVRDHKVRQLSKGMLQRIALAIAMCGQPELLVLDEPFNGLDPVVLDDLQQILREEQDRGATLLIATHTISAVESLATSVAIMCHGQLVALSTLDELRSSHGDEQSLEKIYHQIARQRSQPTVAEVLA